MSRALRILQGRLGRVALLDMDGPLVTHAHRGCHVLLKAGGADSSFRVRDADCPLTDSTAVLVNAWEPHAYTHSLAVHRTLILALYIEPEWLAAMDRSFVCAGHSGFFPRSCVAISPGIGARARLLSQLLLHEDFAAGRAAEEPVFDLMAEVITGFADRMGLAPAISQVRPADFRIRKSIGFMAGRLHQPFDAGVIAQEAGLSRPHFFARFRAVTGLTPALFFNTLRMEDATQRLAASPVSLGEVARALGFEEQANFTRFFRQQQGVTPSSYRQVAHLIA